MIVNHDNCDACNEPGDLLCCDSCPAAFHCECVEPPIRYVMSCSGVVSVMLYVSVLVTGVLICDV